MNHRFTLMPLRGIGALVSMVGFLLLLSCPLLTAATLFPPVINSAVPTYTTNPPQLTIVGTDLGTALPVVTINNLPAVVVTHTNTRVVVQIPAAVYAAPGSYLLFLTRGPDHLFTLGTFDVTIGAGGPQGPPVQSVRLVPQVNRVRQAPRVMQVPPVQPVQQVQQVLGGLQARLALRAIQVPPVQQVRLVPPVQRAS